MQLPHLHLISRTCIWCLRWGWRFEFCQDFWHQKMSPWAIVCCCLCDPAFSRFSRTPTCDRRMERQTSWQLIPALANVAQVKKYTSLPMLSVCSVNGSSVRGTRMSMSQWMRKLTMRRPSPAWTERCWRKPKASVRASACMCTPVPSNRHHQSNGDCMEGKRENYQVCSVQYCAQQLCTVQCPHIWTHLTVLWIGFCLTGPISQCLDSLPLQHLSLIYVACSCKASNALYMQVDCEMKSLLLTHHRNVAVSWMIACWPLWACHWKSDSIP